jgi:hypothetical protein
MDTSDILRIWGIENPKLFTGFTSGAIRVSLNYDEVILSSPKKTSKEIHALDNLSKQAFDGFVLSGLTAGQNCLLRIAVRDLDRAASFVDDVKAMQKRHARGKAAVGILDTEKSIASMQCVFQTIQR